jgi:flagellum-specific ATP synthase
MILSKPRFQRIEDALAAVSRTEVMGRVAEVVGLVIESDGPACRIGDLVLVEPAAGGAPLPCEVVGFKSERLLLMPLGEMEGVRVGSLVRRSEDGLSIPVGDELLGRVLDGLGRPADGLPEPACPDRRGLHGSPPSPLERSLIAEPFATGVRAIDGVLTMGQGQRMGIFAGSGVGKSTLLGMIARHGLAEVNVIALIGERGREVREFIAGELGEEGMAKSIVICATSDEPALLRIKAAFAATAIAEHFRAQGRSVLLMMDSVTRFAMAQREIGLAVGEPPSSKGYTPSVFALLPRLMERAGCSAEGAMTAIYTVLVDGDDTNEPIADAARSILDGHIVLDRRLTSKGHYPPISIPQSLSRVMPMVTEPAHVSAARSLRELMAAYEEVEDLVSVGAYREGSRPIADRAIGRWDEINAFLRQDRAEATPYEQAVGRLQEIVNGQVQA